MADCAIVSARPSARCLPSRHRFRKNPVNADLANAQYDKDGFFLPRAKYSYTTDESDLYDHIGRLWE